MVGIPAIPTCSIDKEATQFAKSTAFRGSPCLDRKSTRLNSSHLGISYAVFCLKKKNVNHRIEFLANMIDKRSPNHQTNIHIIALLTGVDVNSHTVLDGIRTRNLATIQRIKTIG